MQYISYDRQTGIGLAFFRDSASNLPPDSSDIGYFAVSEAVEATRVRIVDGVLEPYAQVVAIVDVKRNAKQAIDQKAGKLRSLVASHGYGQEMTYLAKEAEARAWLADPLQDPTPFKLPCAEIGITGIDMLEVCTKIVAKSDEWRTLAAAIEAVRLGKKNEIDAATTVAEVEAIEATVADAWPTL